MQQRPHDIDSHGNPDPASQKPRRRWYADLTPARLPGVLLAFAVASLGAILFVALSLPLPIFLGALSFCMAASILRAPLMRPMSLSIPMRIVLGVAVGSAFTPALLERTNELAVSLVLIVPFSAVITYAGYLFYSRIAGFDQPTAFFGSVPGGLTDMVTMSEDAGANQRIVTLLSAVRMVMIVFLVPLWMQVVSGASVGGAVINTVHVWEMQLRDGVVLIALGFSGWWLARRFGIAGAAIVGPMIVSGIFHAAGLTSAKVPTELLILAQLTLGILLGAQFRDVTVREFSTYIIWGMAFSAVLLIATLLTATGVSRLTGADEISVLMAYAPGGQSELNLLALILHLDVAFIALHHLVRVAAVIIGAQIVFRMMPEWRKPQNTAD